MDALMMAKSISRQVRTMLVGVHHVKSGYGARAALCCTMEYNRHIDIMTALLMVSGYPE
jgi:tRNA A37 threonylcarbamoyltransferase TsaD